MSSLLLLLAEGAEHGAAEATPALLDPNSAGLIFWTGLTFSIVVVTLYKLAWTPLLEALDQREKSIEGQVREAEGTRQEAEALRQRYEAQLEAARQDAQKIIDEGEADKQRILSTAQTRATEEAAEIKSRAEREIEQAKAKAVAEIKQDAVRLGLAIAEKVIAAEIDQAKHQQLVDSVLAELG